MTKFLVNIDTDTLAKIGNASDNVTGVISIEIDEYHFPEERWNDFVVIILSWWLESINSFLTGNTDVCSCPFMDGPYEYEFRKKNSLWQLSLVERRISKNKICLEREVLPIVVLKSLASATNSVIRACNERGWKNKDLKKLDIQHQGLVKNIRLLGSN